ncbi:hypothetical protein GCM10007231_16170 [Nocardioides daphniae]|uniref:Histidine phosphatase family protein n=1 Tax=Nocardioides daphniae TaxID=402297 RepID=A0ABQ1Q8R6_9ACTN|nr:hypothetical protein GCM10007231_16170 [Nocardioides daphniae]
MWSSPAAYAREAAAAVAATTGGPVVVRTELSPVGDGERGEDVVHRLREVLQEAADLHRGEAVVLVTHTGPLEVGLPRLARMAVRPHPLAAWGLVELEVDEEWWCRAWGVAHPEDADGAPTP